MKILRTILTILIYGSLVFGQGTQQPICYHPDGSAAPVAYQPCNTAANNSMCCATNRSSFVNECRPDGLCKQLDQGYIWRESCTDPTWKAKECLHLCDTGTVETSNYPGDVFITVCTDGSYCCGYQNTACCNNHQGYWIVNGVVTNIKPSSSVISQGQSLSTSRVTQPATPTTPRSSAAIILSSTLPSAVLCGNSAWIPSPQKWNEAAVDEELGKWWKATAVQRGSRSFVDWLSSQFGDKTPNTQCGIHRAETCTLPPCTVWESAKSPMWAYFARVSVVEMNLLFNSMWEGIGDAKSSVALLLSEMASDFFPWSQSETAKLRVNQIAPWLDVGAAAALSLVPPPFSIATGVVTPFVSAGIHALMDEDVSKRHELLSIQSLGTFMKSSADDFHRRLESWSQILFSGQQDASGNTILDYMRQGRFTLNYDVQSSVVSDLYFQLLVSRAQNQTYHIYVMCANSSSSNCHQNSAFQEGTRTCCLYSADTKLNLAVPPSLDKLMADPYDINPRDITASSLHSYQVAGLDYDETKSVDRILTALREDPKKQLMYQRTSFEGIWTLPVCDVGTHADWVDEYSAKKYPCCCGVNCAETKEFMKRVGAGSSFDGVCKTQYPPYGPTSGSASLTQGSFTRYLWTLVAATAGFSWL